MQGIIIPSDAKKVVFDGKSWYIPTRSKYFYYDDSRIGGKRHKVALHRYIYEKYSGQKVLPGNDVHHLDLDSRNNDFVNLIQLDATEHNRYHMTKRWEDDRAGMTAGTQVGRDATKAWHKSDAGREWHRKHGAEVWANRESFKSTKICIGCGATYDTYRSVTLYCSNPCWQRANYKLKKHLIVCEFCGKEAEKKDRRVRFCSRECAMKGRRNPNDCR